MKKLSYVLAVLALFCLLCPACGSAPSPQDTSDNGSGGGLNLCGEAVDNGYLRYEPEWEAIYAYSELDDSGSRIAMEDGQLYCAAYGYFNPGEGMEYLWYEDGGGLTEDDESVHALIE